MPWVKRETPPAAVGKGVLKLGARQWTVDYALRQHPSQLRAGPRGIRGSIDTTAETAAEAFRVGDGYLVLDGGREFRVKVLAHTIGSPTAYIELRRD